MDGLYGLSVESNWPAREDQLRVQIYAYNGPAPLQYIYGMGAVF